MTFKTSLRKIWENPLHPAWIILAMLELLVFIICFNRFVLESNFVQSAIGWDRPYLFYSYRDDANLIVGSPFLGAGGVRLSEAITAFAGKPTTETWGLVHWLTSISMVLAYIVGPSLFLWGLKARKARITGGPARRSSFAPLIATATGGYIVAVALLFPTVTAVKSWTIFQRMKADSYTNAIRDGAVASVSILGFQAEQIRLMPEAKGGGPWMKGPRGITIADLDTVLPHLERALWEPGAKGSMKYFLEVDTPDSLTIWGVANAHGEFGGVNFRNRDSTTSNVQVRAGVTPERVTATVEN